MEIWRKMQTHESFRPMITPKSPRFYNPIAEAFDPVIVTHKGYYYLIGTSKDNHLRIQKSPTIAGLGPAPAKIVYTGSGTDLGCSTLWSPSLQYLKGRWYIYFSTTNAERTRWADYVLEGQEDDPLGPYTLKGVLSVGETGHGIIGPSAFEMPDGSLYFTTTTFGFYIQQMKNPWTLTGTRVTVDDGSPTFDWEGGTSETSRAIVHLVNEKPIVIVPYSSENYVTARSDGGPGWSWCVGMFINRDSNVLDPRSWEKAPYPVFAGGPNTGLFQVLAVNTFKSLDGSEDWIVYNALDVLDNWFGDRDTFVQRFEWKEDGTPNFGHPIPLGLPIEVPSGEQSSPPAVSPGTVLLQDSFNDRKNWTIRRGEWHAEGSLFFPQVSERRDAENIAVAGEPSWGDYCFEAIVQVNDVEEGGIALLARVQEDGSGYSFELVSTPSSVVNWRICRIENEHEALATGYFPLKTDKQLMLRFIVNNERLSAVASEDGKSFVLLGEARDSAYAYGRVGLLAWGDCRVQVTHVKVVKELPRWGLYTGPGWMGIRINTGSLPKNQFGEDWVSAVIADETSPGEKKANDSYVHDCFYIGGDSSMSSDTVSTDHSINPPPLGVLQIQRVSSKRFCYVIPSLKKGYVYRVRLHFVELIYTSAGRRTFNVTINGKPELMDFDIVLEAGSNNSAIVKDFTVLASETGHILIEFSRGSTGNGGPVINAIEVLPFY